MPRLQEKAPKFVLEDPPDPPPCERGFNPCSHSFQATPSASSRRLCRLTSKSSKAGPPPLPKILDPPRCAFAQSCTAVSSSFRIIYVFMQATNTPEASDGDTSISNTKDLTRKCRQDPPTIVYGESVTHRAVAPQPAQARTQGGSDRSYDPPPHTHTPQRSTFSGC